jgi:hypothetical protein
MPKNKNLKNPFETDQWLSELVALSPEVEMQARDSLKTFKAQQQSQKSFWQIITESKAWKWAHLSTKNAILAGLLSFLFLASVGTLAAQIAAPQKFKPTTQIKNILQNKPQQTPEPQQTIYTSLKPDANFAVAQFHECNLALKFPRTIQNTSTTIYKPKPTETANNYPAVVIEMQTDTAQENMSKPTNLSLSCKPKSNDINVVDTINLTPFEFQNLTKWPLAFEAQVQNIQISNTQTPNKTLHFQFNDVEYTVSYTQPQTNTDGVGIDQIQVQFNSLAQNEFDTQIGPAPEKNQPSPNSTDSAIVSPIFGKLMTLVKKDEQNTLYFKETNCAEPNKCQTFITKESKTNFDTVGENYYIWAEVKSGPENTFELYNISQIEPQKQNQNESSVSLNFKNKNAFQILTEDGKGECKNVVNGKVTLIATDTQTATVIEKNSKLTSEQTKQFDTLKSKLEDNKPITGAALIEPFNAGCANNLDMIAGQLPITYPGTEKARAFYTIYKGLYTNQPIIKIVVFATVSDNTIIRLENTYYANHTGLLSTQDLQKCKLKSSVIPTQLSQENVDCMSEELGKNEKAKLEMLKKAEELTETFRIE